MSCTFKLETKISAQKNVTEEQYTVVQSQGLIGVSNCYLKFFGWLFLHFSLLTLPYTFWNPANPYDTCIIW